MALLDGFRITRTGIVFIVGIIVLIAAVIGTILIVRDRGEQARRQDAVEVAQQNLEDQSETTTEETKPAATSSSEEAQTETTTPAQTQTETPTTTTPASNKLPETGTDLNVLIAVTLLALSASYYIVSRRAVRGL